MPSRTFVPRKALGIPESSSVANESLWCTIRARRAEFAVHGELPLPTQPHSANEMGIQIQKKEMTKNIGFDLDLHSH